MNMVLTIQLSLKIIILSICTSIIIINAGSDVRSSQTGHGCIIRSIQDEPEVSDLAE